MIDNDIYKDIGRKRVEIHKALDNFLTKTPSGMLFINLMSKVYKIKNINLLKEILLYERSDGKILQDVMDSKNLDATEKFKLETMLTKFNIYKSKLNELNTIFDRKKELDTKTKRKYILPTSEVEDFEDIFKDGYFNYSDLTPVDTLNLPRKKIPSKIKPKRKPVKRTIKQVIKKKSCKCK